MDHRASVTSLTYALPSLEIWDKTLKHSMGSPASLASRVPKPHQSCYQCTVASSREIFFLSLCNAHLRCAGLSSKRLPWGEKGHCPGAIWPPAPGKTRLSCPAWYLPPTTVHKCKTNSASFPMVIQPAYLGLGVDTKHPS